MWVSMCVCVRACVCACVHACAFLLVHTDSSMDDLMDEIHGFYNKVSNVTA